MLSDAERRLYYQGLGLRPPVVKEIEDMRIAAPAREVGQRGLTNTLVEFHSKKNARRDKLESYTSEWLFALELELFGACHEYFVQVQPKNIDRYGKTSSLTADFMVFEPQGIRLVECKHHTHLLKLANSKPHEWRFQDGRWDRPFVSAWAEDRGLRYDIWSPPQPHGIYQANLLVLYAQQCSSSNADEAASIGRLHKHLQTHTLTIDEALTQISGLTGADVAAALASGRVFGPLRSVPLSESNRFVLYTRRAQALSSDDQLLKLIQAKVAQPLPLSPLIRASPVDYAYSEERLERVRRMISDQEKITRRFRPVVEDVLTAQAEGRSELEACLTHFANCGRRVGQLTGDQESALELAISQYRRDPNIRDETAAHDKLVEHCEAIGIRPPCRTTFRARLHRVSPMKRGYTEGGYRGMHAVEPISDPSVRTMRCIVPGLMVHIDSTKFDERCSPDFLATLGFECPTVYIAMCSGTERPLGRAVLFGHACRNALAVLIRDIWHRQGFLPRYWIADGGAEYIGPWFNQFCSYLGASRIQPPPGNPRKNSLAENALGRINAELAHRFLGSTKPDQKGRSVTSGKKSYATACHNYATVVSHLDRYLFEDLPSTPTGVQRETASEKNERLIELLGNVGVATVQNMDDFLIATSIPLERDITVDRSRGIRYLSRRYASAELLLQMRIHAPIEKRLDCVDPCRMYVKFPGKWVLALTSDSLRTSGQDELMRLFETLTDPEVRSRNTELRNAKRRERARRTAAANEAAGSTSHLAYMLDTPKEEKEEPGKRESPITWSDPSELLEPFGVVKEAEDDCNG